VPSYIPESSNCNDIPNDLFIDKIGIISHNSYIILHMEENMGEVKKCKHCQSEIDKKAKVCPNCRRKQGGKGKFIILGVIVFFIVAGALSSLNEDTTKTSNTNTQKANGDSSDSKAADIVALGSEGQSENLALKVNEVGDTDEIKENDFLSYKPDSGKYAIVNITIKNTGKESTSLTNGYFKLITSDGAEYSPTILIGLDNKYISFESINPGLDITGNLVFEVPKDLVVTDTTLKFSGTGLFTKATIFGLK
jgi:hypothetical protein